MNPLYVNNDCFVYSDKREQASGELRIENLIINKYNYRSFCREYSLPHSLVLSLMSNKSFKTLNGNNFSALKGSGDFVAFVDIETSDDESFEFAYVKELDGDFHFFKDPIALCNYLKNFDVIAGFNLFRFDYEVLSRYVPQFFETVKQGNFVLRIPKSKITLDLLFYYQVHKPFAPSHKLIYLARDIGFNYTADFSDKKNKCRQDVLVCEKFYKIAECYYNFIVKNFNLDFLSFSTIPGKWLGKLRRYFFQSYCLKNKILPKLVRKETNLKPDYYRYFKRGYYENVYSFDISQTYPNTIINLNLSLYKRNDLKNYMKFWIDKRKEVGDFAKYVANAFIGDLGSQYSMIYDREIMVRVWLHVKKVMEDWVRKIRKKNVVYAYTDNVVTPLKEVPRPEGYDVKMKSHYEWLVVYNIQRILGFDGQSIVRTHFIKKYPQLKMWDYVDSKIDEILLSRSRKRFLLNPEKYVNKIRIGSLSDDNFKIVIRKDSDVCKVVDYFDIWDDLSFGFNEVFLSRNGLSKEPDKKFYLNILKDYLKLYKCDRRWLK